MAVNENAAGQDAPTVFAQVEAHPTRLLVPKLVGRTAPKNPS